MTWAFKLNYKSIIRYYKKETKFKNKALIDFFWR